MESGQQHGMPNATAATGLTAFVVRASTSADCTIFLPTCHDRVMAGNGGQLVVDGRSIKITNPDKVMYPATGTTKGEVIAYYQAVAPWFVLHAAGRPATRKRWPNGVGTPEHPQRPFFHKNLELKSTPDWVATHAMKHSDGSNVYPLINDAATLVWLAQLAALEIHVPQWRVGADGRPERPNRLVLDLDPGEGAGLPQCVEVAHLIREVLDEVGLASYPVTSGSKGIHLYAGLAGELTSAQASDWAKELARSLESLHPNLVVADMGKAIRRGKVLLDWSQNNPAKTTIAPYSLRGRERPTVAAPRSWDELTPDVGQLDFHEVLARLQDVGDLLAGLDDDQDAGHGAATTEPGAQRPAAVDADRLTRYRSLRDAERTPEPVPQASPQPRPEGNSFVIQEHHARRLHYDFRLERAGVLVSWAVPKGPPTDPKINHLAVQTEDHPLAYGGFEGEIPKGEYGAGKVIIWDAGSYQTHKWADGREVIATLTGRPDGGLGGQPRTFALIHTGHGEDDKNWLIHLMTERPDDTEAPEAPEPTEASQLTEGPRPPAPPEPLGSRGLPTIEPMLATPGTANDVRGEGWVFEVKWDGFRAVASVADGLAAFSSRGGIDLTGSYPELAELGALLGGHRAVLDGEIVALDDAGRPQFELLQNHARNPGRAHYMVFDLLHLDGRSLLRRPYAQRRAELFELLGAGSGHIHLPGDLGTDAEVALAVSVDQQLEGVVAKQAGSIYRPGKRGRTWVKVKNKLSVDVVIVGWAPGERSRAETLGSLLVAVPDGEQLTYAGRVGTGFTERALAEARELLGEIETDEPPVRDVPAADAKGVHWVEPLLVGEVTYGALTRSGRLRHPVWKGWRPDLDPGDLRSEDPDG